jgi:hypothetical protein
MTLDQLKSLEDPSPLSVPLQALCADLRGEWDRAHTLAQEANNRDGDWVHAYLHRKEGDIGNAGYWYARAGRDPQGADVSLETEWDAIATELLARGE